MILIIHSLSSTQDEVIENWKSSAMNIIRSEDAFVFNSGQGAWRYEIENRGRSMAFITELEGRAVTLTCFGDFSAVDQMAATLSARQ